MKNIKEGFNKIAESMFDDLVDNDVKIVNAGFSEHILKKEASAITTVLPAIIGSLVGMKTTQGLNARDQERRDLNAKVIQNRMGEGINSEKENMFGKDYYSQIANLNRNLQPTFSPFGVMYIINYKGTNITLDNIDTSEMNDEMRKAWASQDKDYYKRLFMNKIVSEAQLVEQMFAKRMVQNFDSMNQRFGVKQASYDESNMVDLIDGLCKIKDIYTTNNNSRVIEILSSSFGKCEEEIEIKCELNRPIDKYAGIMSTALDFLGMNSPTKQLKAVARDLSNVKSVSEVKVEFLPDRVLYIKNNLVVTQLPVLSMNEEGYAHFREKDTPYFKEEFNKNLIKNVNMLREINKDLTKNASELIKKEDIFKRSDIDAKIYMLVLNKELGNNWVSYDPEVLISEIEDTFHLQEPICDVALNKILAIQLVNSSIEPYRNALIFEKCIRAFNDKSIEFDEWQLNIEAKELLYGVMRMNDVSMLDNISDNFSEEIVDYIVTILFNSGIRNLTDEVGGVNKSLTDEFYEVVNAELLDKWNTYMMDTSNNSKKMTEDNISIATISNKLYNSINNITSIGGEKIDELINKLSTTHKLTEFVTNCIRQTIKQNAIIDSYCNMKNLEAEDQMTNVEQ